jgi:hypothetical protein
LKASASELRHKPRQARGIFYKMSGGPFGAMAREILGVAPGLASNCQKENAALREQTNNRVVIKQTS